MGTHKGYSGVFTPKHPNKYKGDVTNIVFRSLLERRYMKLFDEHASVLEWGSEEVIVPYKYDLDGKMHRYFEDLYAKIKNVDGSVNKYLFEIKPEKFTQMPVMPKKQTKRYINELAEFVKNKNKWDSAKKYAKQNGAHFVILTEKDIEEWQAEKNRS